jgi:hypothetical protein
MSRSHGVSVRLSEEMLARLDGIAAAWGLNRAATVRRLVELADVDAGPVGVPSMDELVAIASEKARWATWPRCRSGGTAAGSARGGLPAAARAVGSGLAVSELVLDALRALGGRPSLEEIERVAAALRKCGDREVMALFALGSPISEREAWERFIALVQEHDEALGFTALDVFCEVRSPGGQRRLRGRLVETCDRRRRRPNWQGPGP